MKRLTTNHAAIAICAVAAFFFTSCIYDSAGDNALVTFIDGWRDGDTLHLIWKKEGDLSPQTAILQRLSAYE